MRNNRTNDVIGSSLLLRNSCWENCCDANDADTHDKDGNQQFDKRKTASGSCNGTS